LCKDQPLSRLPLNLGTKWVYLSIRWGLKYFSFEYVGRTILVLDLNQPHFEITSLKGFW
jgi:hypothetical protein